MINQIIRLHFYFELPSIVSEMALQNRLTNDSLLFNQTVVTQLSRVTQSVSAFNGDLRGTVDFSAAMILGLLPEDATVSAVDIGAGPGDFVQSSDIDGNISLRRLKAGTDIKVSSTAETLSVELADTISRTTATFSGGVTVTGATNVENLGITGSLTLTGPSTINSGTVTGLPAFAPTLWNPSSNGDLLTFTSQGEALTHPPVSGTKVLQRNNASVTGLSWVDPPAPVQLPSLLSPLTSNEIVYTDGTTFVSLPAPAMTGSATDPTRTKLYLGYGSSLTWSDPLIGTSGPTTANGTPSGLAVDIATKTLSLSGGLGAAPTTRYFYVDNGLEDPLNPIFASQVSVDDIVWQYPDGAASITTISTQGLTPYKVQVPGVTTYVRVLTNGTILGRKLAVLDVFDGESWNPTVEDTTDLSITGTNCTRTRSRQTISGTLVYTTRYTLSTTGATQSLYPVWSVVPTSPSYASAMALVRETAEPIPAAARISRAGTESAPILYIDLVYYPDTDTNTTYTNIAYWEMVTSRAV